MFYYKGGKVSMKKARLAASILTGLLSVGVLAGCNEVRYSKEGAKWFNKKYFYQRLGKHLKKEDIDAYRRSFDEITDFLNLKPVPVFKKHSDIMFDSPKPIYEIKYVENDKLHIKQVDKETFENTNSLKRAKEI